MKKCFGPFRRDCQNFRLPFGDSAFLFSVGNETFERSKADVGLLKLRISRRQMFGKRDGVSNPKRQRGIWASNGNLRPR